MRTFTVLPVILLLAGGLSAQSTESKPPATPAPHMTGAMMPMCNMQACREKCEATAASAERALTLIDEAAGSTDPVKLRAALDAARVPLVTMKTHMASCTMMMHQGPGHGAKAPEPVPPPKH